MGFVLSISATPAYTGRLTVTYRAPTPLGVEIEIQAWLASRQGRKLRIEAEARHGTTLFAHGEGLFIAVDPEQLRGRVTALGARAFRRAGASTDRSPARSPAMIRRYEPAASAPMASVSRIVSPRSRSIPSIPNRGS